MSNNDDMKSFRKNFNGELFVAKSFEDESQWRRDFGNMIRIFETDPATDDMVKMDFKYRNLDYSNADDLRSLFVNKENCDTYMITMALVVSLSTPNEIPAVVAARMVSDVIRHKLVFLDSAVGRKDGITPDGMIDLCFESIKECPSYDFARSIKKSLVAYMDLLMVTHKVMISDSDQKYKNIQKYMMNSFMNDADIYDVPEEVREELVEAQKDVIDGLGSAIPQADDELLEKLRNRIRKNLHLKDVLDPDSDEFTVPNDISELEDLHDEAPVENDTNKSQLTETDSQAQDGKDGMKPHNSLGENTKNVFEQKNEDGSITAWKSASVEGFDASNSNFVFGDWFVSVPDSNSSGLDPEIVENIRTMQNFFKNNNAVKHALNILKLHMAKIIQDEQDRAANIFEENEKEAAELLLRHMLDQNNNFGTDDSDDNLDKEMERNSMMVRHHDQSVEYGLKIATAINAMLIFDTVIMEVLVEMSANNQSNVDDLWKNIESKLDVGSVLAMEVNSGMRPEVMNQEYINEENFSIYTHALELCHKILEDVRNM